MYETEGNNIKYIKKNRDSAAELYGWTRERLRWRNQRLSMCRVQNKKKVISDLKRENEFLSKRYGNLYD
jgi:hypothetical protein